MNDVLASVVESLGRTTLCLAAVGVVVAATLRLTRTSWPAAHRLGWVVTLLVGWTFLRLPVAVPWYEPPAPAQSATLEAPSAGLPQRTLHVDPFAEPATEPFAALPSSASDEVIEIGPAAQAPWPSQTAEIDPAVSAGSEAVVAPIGPLPPANEPVATTLSDPPAIAPPAAPPVNDWPRIALAAWLTGMVVIVAASAIGYVGFVRRLVPCPCRDTWQEEWSNLVIAAGVRRAIPLRVTAGQGPMLCRLPRGMELVVPERLWRDLSPAGRRAILRHELAHYLRGDIWKSLAARVLALPHWFNPVAWLAVRRFEEAAEWACDAAAADDSATDYARVLLQLGEAAPQPAYASSAGGRTLAARIRRVLSGPARPDSRLKKSAIVTVALLLVGASIVQLNLVAKQPTERQVAATDPDADPFADAPAATPPAAVDPFAVPRQVAATDPAADPFADAPPADSPAAEDPFAAPPRADDVDPAEAPLADAPSAKTPAEEPPLADAPSDKSSPPSDPALPVAAADATSGPLLAEAAKIYQWAIDDFLAHKTSVEPMYEWSRRWMEVAERVAGDSKGRIAAAEAHVKRMRELLTRVEKLRELQSKGGEGSQYFASKFYVAEAERHLADVKAAKTAASGQRSFPGPEAFEETDPDAAPQPAAISPESAKQALAEVKQTYLDAQGQFESGKLSIDGVYEWSERYRQAAERAAADQAGKVQAAQDHLERMKEAFRRIEAAYQVGSKEGSADRLNAAKVFVAEAERRLVEVKSDDLPKEIPQGETESQRLSKEQAELIYRLKRDVEHYGNQARALELSRKRPNVQAIDADAFKRRQKEFEKLRDQAQKRLTEATRGAVGPLPVPSRAFDEKVEKELAKDPVVVELSRRLEDMRHALARYTATAAEPDSSPTVRDLKKQINQIEQAIDEHKAGQRPRLVEKLAAHAEAPSAVDPAQQRLRSEIEAVDLEVKIAELHGQLLTEEARFKQLSEANAKAPGAVAQMELKTSRIKIETLHRQLTLLNKKLALTKDLADREKQSTQSPQPKPTTGASKTLPPHAELDLVAAEVPSKPELNLISKADPASKLRYNGKPFHAWAETLRDDLSPASRTEAIEALAMFGRFGLADEAAKAILAAMRDYSVWSMDGTAEGKLKFAATKAFKELPEKVTSPLLTTALASDSGNQRLFAATILGGQVRDPKEREKLFVPLLDDSDVEVRRMAATSLQGQADKYLAVVEIMREAIASPDKDVANWAVQVIGLKNPQPFVPVLPTLVERLDTDELPLLQQFQMALLRFGRMAIPALEAGEQSENHRVRAMSQQTLQQIRSAAPPVASEDSPQKPGTEPATEASYRNKPLRSWLSILRRDLSPESRTEAIGALAVFGAHGHSREVAEAIMEMMGDYSIADMSASPDAPLKVAALDAFLKLDRGKAEPLVTEALQGKNANRRMFAAVILDQWVPKDVSLDLDELLADPDPKARLVFAGIVVRRDVTNARALEIVRAGLESSDSAQKSAAYASARDVISRLKPGEGVEGPVLDALKKLGPAMQPIMKEFVNSSAANQAEVEAALRLMTFDEGEANK